MCATSDTRSCSVAMHIRGEIARLRTIVAQKQASNTDLAWHAAFQVLALLICVSRARPNQTSESRTSAAIWYERKRAA